MSCLFCKFVSGELDTNKVYENEKVLGFVDINPQAKEHYLFVSKTHSENVNTMTKNNGDIEAVFSAIREFTEGNDLAKNGFRVVTNQGPHGCQSVFHTHFHVLGGEQLAGFGR